MMEWVDQQLEALAVLVGFPSDQLAMIVCLLLNYPLGFLFLTLGNHNGKPSQTMIALRHIYSAAPTIFFSAWLLGWDTLHSLVSSLLGYAIMRLYARSNPECGRVMFVYAMAYMSLSHIYRFFFSWSIMSLGSLLNYFNLACTTRI